MQENGEDDYLYCDLDYVANNAPKNDISHNDANGSNENDDGYDVGIDEDDEDEDEDDDSSNLCYY